MSVLNPRATVQRAQEKSIVLGIEQGIEQVAINMLKANKPFAEISLFTSLSEDAIAKLKGSLLKN